MRKEPEQSPTVLSGTQGWQWEGEDLRADRNSIASSRVLGIHWMRYIRNLQDCKRDTVMYRFSSRVTEEGNGKYDECFQHIVYLSLMYLTLSASSSLLDGPRYIFRCLLVGLNPLPIVLVTFLSFPQLPAHCSTFPISDQLLFIPLLECWM